MAAMDVLSYGKGRATRMEFWVATLVLPAIYPIGVSVPFDYWTKQFPYLLVFLLAAGWAHFAVRRCHDRDKSGWWCLVTLVPIAGQIWVLTQLGFREGTEGTNRFGPDPLADMRAQKAAARDLLEKRSPEYVKRHRNAAYALYQKISALDTGVPDVDRLIEALRLFELETGKDIRLHIDTYGLPPRPILRRSERGISHNLVVEDGVYVDAIQDRSDRYEERYLSLDEAVFEFAADFQTCNWVRQFRKENIPVK
jgi:uncharacterized membrane protein YhaH (DUF805 family)